MYKIKKSVLFNFLKKHLNENRTYNNPTGNFIHPYQKNSEEDTPIVPSEHVGMSNQISVEKLPVDDPDFMPATQGELSVAAGIIAKEVPAHGIDFFYRELHNLLDKTLDRSPGMLGECINLLSVSDSLDNIYMRDAVKNIKQGQNLNEAVNKLKQNRIFYDYTQRNLKNILKSILLEGAEDRFIQRGKIMIARGEDPNSVIDNLFQQRVFQVKGISKDQIGEMLGITSATSQVPQPVDPVATGVKSSPAVRRRKKVQQDYPKDSFQDPVSGIDYDVDDEGFLKSIDDIEGPSDELMLQTDSKLILANSLARLLDELERLTEEAKAHGWQFDEQVAPFLQEINLFFQALFEVSYRAIESQMTITYGGYTYDPELDTGYKRGGFKIIPKGPLSRSEAKNFIDYIERTFGINKTTTLRQSNILKMDRDALKGVVRRVIDGVLSMARMKDLTTRLENKRKKAYALYIKQPNSFEPSIGEKFSSMDASLDLIADIMTLKYRKESKIPDANAIDRVIEGIFKFTISKLEEPYKIKNINAFKRKAQEFPKYYKQNLPKLILVNLTKSKAAKVEVTGTKFIITDNNGLSTTYKKGEVLKKIKQFVEDAMAGKEILPDESDAVIDEFEAAEQSIDNMEFDSAEQKNETLKILSSIEKLVKTGDKFEYDATAPIFNFSSASGLRQWALKFIDPRMAIIKGSRQNKKGATKFLNYQRNMRDTMIRYFLDQEDGKPGIISLFLNELSQSNQPIDKEKMQIVQNMKAQMERMKDMHEMPGGFNRLKTNPEYQKLLRTQGGAVARFAAGVPLDKVLKNLNKDWKLAIQKQLRDNYGFKNNKDIVELSEHFTGQKNKPDFAAKHETAKRFVELGMDDQMFEELFKWAENWFFRRLEIEFRPNAASYGKEPRQGNFNKIITFFNKDLYKSSGKIDNSIYKPLLKIFKDSYEDYIQQASGEEVLRRAKTAVTSLRKKAGLDVVENKTNFHKLLKQFVRKHR